VTEHPLPHVFALRDPRYLTGCLYRRDQPLRRIYFAYEGVGTSLKHLALCFGPVAQDDHVRLRAALPQRLQPVSAMKALELPVEYNHIGAGFPHLLHQIVGVRRLADQLQPRSLP
jgi:hypothetical protein